MTAGHDQHMPLARVIFSMLTPELVQESVTFTEPPPYAPDRRCARWPDGVAAFIGMSTTGEELWLAYVEGWTLRQMHWTAFEDHIAVIVDQIEHIKDAVGREEN